MVFVPLRFDDAAIPTDDKPARGTRRRTTRRD
jgi:hypothetical protein